MNSEHNINQAYLCSARQLNQQCWPCLYAAVATAANRRGAWPFCHSSSYPAMHHGSSNNSPSHLSIACSCKLDHSGWSTAAQNLFMFLSREGVELCTIFICHCNSVVIWYHIATCYHTPSSNVVHFYQWVTHNTVTCCSLIPKRKTIGTGTTSLSCISV